MAESGDNTVSTPNLYGGSVNQLKVSLPRLGIQTRFTGRAETPQEFLAISESYTRTWLLDPGELPRATHKAKRLIDLR